MSDTIEQVIERLTYAIDFATDCEVYRGTVCDIDSNDIRILLEALSRNREPTEAMVEAGAESLLGTLHWNGGFEYAWQRVRFIYLAMERARTKGESESELLDYGGLNPREPE